MSRKTLLIKSVHPLRMMESCLADKPERVGPVEVEDIKRDLLDEFSALPAQGGAPSQTETLQVYLRVRPFTARESDSGETQECIAMEGPDTVVLKAPRSCQSNRQSEKPLPQTAQRFTFTQVFGPEASQKTVFEGSVRSLVRDVLNGGNCLVFTYGVTNAGKTFTFVGPDHDSGLLPRSLAIIFNSIEGRVYGRSDLKPQRCRDFCRLTAEQQTAESSCKKRLLRLLKESDRSLTSCRSMFLEGSSVSNDSSVSEADSFSLDVGSNTHFSVWVSFCEIYNENIHDLLEQVPNRHKRAVLRLSQDVRGNSFIKDLHWVQVSSSDEAYKLMKVGRKNQSFSSTQLNHLSSRSHSIFSIRILRVEDSGGVPRVLGISELALCDLAGSERCSRTLNTGGRLKEAGNINSSLLTLGNSLLTLGKCINAMRLNQNAKFQHHIPFRESKLTHFLQFFFCGAGRVSMVVNINQNPSSFDETLNVLKFSALAQKVVVLNSRPVVAKEDSQRSAMELSMIINKAEHRRNAQGRGRKSSMLAWETTLEDVPEDEGGEEVDEEDEDEEEEMESVMEETVLEAGGEEDEDETTAMEEDEEKQADREAVLRLVLEAQIREEVGTEFMALFRKMEKDFEDRLEKEKEILEERADRRVEIMKNLFSRTAQQSSKEEQAALLEGFISSMSEDIEKIREDAQSVHQCLSEHTHAAELEGLRLEKQQSHDELQEVKQNLQQQKREFSELMLICQQKDDVINKLQAAMDGAAEDATRDRNQLESIRTELLQLQLNCCCMKTGSEEEERRRRQRDVPEEDRGPNKKRVVLEEEIWRLQEENDKKEETIFQLRAKEEEVEKEKTRLEEELRTKEEALEEERTRLEEDLRRREEVEELKKEQVLLQQKVEKLTAEVEEERGSCSSVFSSLESEQKETFRLTKENKALINGIFQLQTQVTTLQMQNLQSQSEEKDKTIDSLTQEVDRLTQEADSLRQEVKEEGRGSSSVFHAAMEELRKQSEAALERSAQKSRELEALQREKVQLEKTLADSEEVCIRLREEASCQKAEFSCQLQSLQAENEAQRGALRQRLEELERAEEERRRRMEKSQKEGMSSLKEEALQCRREEEEEKENRVLEERKVSVVEELKAEMQRHQEKRRRRRRERKQPEEEEEEEEEGGRRRRRSQEFEAVRREVERLQKLKEEKEAQMKQHVPHLEQEVSISPLRHNTKKTPKTTGRKRKSSEVEDLVYSENKRNRLRGNTRNNKQSSSVEKRKDGTLQKIGDLIHSSPSILGSKAKTIIGLVSGHLLEKESVTMATKTRRGRKKLYKTEFSPLLFSPNTVTGGAVEEKESDHNVIKRQLRSKMCRK
ncbi:hypothetical protein LDENG_00135440 [Lucifuga dentata]|nr:hypothetical protein LDENG_00135440 [Lucifuga dentata]